MKDRIGKELQIGDKVAYSLGTGKNVSLATVVGFDNSNKYFEWAVIETESGRKINRDWRGVIIIERKTND